ncbi:MAG: PadR family transcriptional regulator [Planctomycetes bacterium]|nr:PadR family transcriptional regulator [Planctomycetota bacterium]
MSDNPIARHFFNGFIRLHILYHAAKEATFGAEMAEELVHHGYRLSQGTLYPTLHVLERQGFLRSHRKLIHGRWRTYYRATRDGRKVLDEARQKLQELVAEVIEDQDQGFQKIRRNRNRSRSLQAATAAPARTARPSRAKAHGYKTESQRGRVR